MNDRPDVTGTWRIVEMDGLRRSDLDAVVDAFISFEPNGGGEFEFGATSGALEYWVTYEGNRPFVDFEWRGQSEMDPYEGEGSLRFEDGRDRERMVGEFVFEQSDEWPMVIEREK